LQNAGWTVLPKPKRLIVGRRVSYVDLVAVQGERQIYVEVKCFADPDSSHEQYIAVGQYLLYRAMLERLEDSTPLYLAIPSTIQTTGIDLVLRRVLENNQIRRLVVDMEMETISQWNE
jgi:hypothetical protein